MGRTMRRALLLGGAGGPIQGTWDPAKKGSNVTLSGGNLIATGGVGSPEVVLGTIGNTVRQGSFKATLTAFNGADTVGVGIGNASASLSGLLGDTNSIAYYTAGFIRFNGVNPITGLATFTTGDIIETVFDALTQVVYWKKNGVLVAGSSISFTGITGAVYAAALMRQASDAWTGNFTT